MSCGRGASRAAWGSSDLRSDTCARPRLGRGTPDVWRVRRVVPPKVNGGQLCRACPRLTGGSSLAAEARLLVVAVPPAVRVHHHDDPLAAAQGSDAGTGGPAHDAHREVELGRRGAAVMAVASFSQGRETRPAACRNPATRSGVEGAGWR